MQNHIGTTFEMLHQEILRILIEVQQQSFGLSRGSI